MKAILRMQFLSGIITEAEYSKQLVLTESAPDIDKNVDSWLTNKDENRITYWKIVGGYFKWSEAKIKEKLKTNVKKLSTFSLVSRIGDPPSVAEVNGELTFTHPTALKIGSLDVTQNVSGHNGACVVHPTYKRVIFFANHTTNHIEGIGYYGVLNQLYFVNNMDIIEELDKINQPYLIFKEMMRSCKMLMAGATTSKFEKLIWMNTASDMLDDPDMHVYKIIYQRGALESAYEYHSYEEVLADQAALFDKNVAGRYVRLCISEGLPKGKIFLPKPSPLDPSQTEEQF